MAVSFAGVLALLLLGAAGGHFRDLVSLIPAEDYFEYRGIDAKPEALIQLIRKEPADARDVIARLLAIRRLGEQKVQAAREPLEQIAQGKLGKDGQGFARDYARWSLGRIIDKEAPERGPPKDSLRDGLAWFPEDLTFFGVLDLRGLAGARSFPEDEVRALVVKMTPKEARHEAYKLADAIGNVRIDRVSFALALDVEPKKKGRIFARITGLGDHQRVAGFIRDTAGTTAFKQDKLPGGESVTLLSHPTRAPAFAVIGDTELLIAGYEGEENALEVLEQALAVRNGKPNLLQGEGGKLLAHASPKAAAVVAGVVPNELKENLQRAGLSVPWPKTVRLELIPNNGLRFELHAVMEKEADAKKLADLVAALKQQSAKAVADLGLKPELAKPIVQTVESVRLNAQGTTLHGDIQITNESLKAIGSWFLNRLRQIE